MTAFRRRGGFRIRRRAGRRAAPPAIAPGGIVVEGELCVLADERRMVLDIDGPAERDLADVVRAAAEGLQMGDVVHVGPVRIEITPLDEP